MNRKSFIQQTATLSIYAFFIQTPWFIQACSSFNNERKWLAEVDIFLDTLPESLPENLINELLKKLKIAKVKNYDETIIALIQIIKEDYLLQKTIIVNGWVLSQTEIALVLINRK